MPLNITFKEEVNIISDWRSCGLQKWSIHQSGGHAPYCVPTASQVEKSAQVLLSSDDVYVQLVSNHDLRATDLQGVCAVEQGILQVMHLSGFYQLHVEHLEMAERFLSEKKKLLARVKLDEETNEWDATKTILSYQSIATENQDQFALDYSQRLNDSIFTTFAPSNMKCNEDTLMHNSLHSPLNWLFGCDNRLQCDWEKNKDDLPDFTGYFTEYRKHFDIFVVEVKKPGVIARVQHCIPQYHSDIL
ncbi:hypothetical protein BDA99DRAFT_535843 [Phascolomyces articulosus]|uniref:Uncharacterized protein n=1 Tax=Phascolomyces articulosus TaxID=60185 RepID=A0AAD5KEC0_9FUNG|nr:hypothetical protein BDA99DRAFT_535843 [Phascolomyces articulosus]